MPNQDQLNNRAEWLAALRSGKYQQSTHWLCTKNGYCCLGVAAELAGALRSSPILGEGIKEMSIPTKGENNEFFGTSFPPDDWFAERFGINAPSLMGRLAELNDSRDYNFHQIADIIERTFPTIDAGEYAGLVMEAA